MKLLVTIARFFVGILFIFSGFIKLNDPLGFSYKLQEYFGEGVLNLEFLIPFALLIAIFLVIFEILVGITLLLGYLPKLTLWTLLGMILFFTFLTFYSAYFNKVTDCGCFGDAIPLTPWQSFSKDVVLTILILILFFGRRYSTPILPVASHKWIVFVCFSCCLGYAYYVLMYLPVFDFRPYKVGVNIKEDMEVPAGAPEAVFEYNWRFEVDGQEKIITTTGEYPTIAGKFITVETKEIEEGYIPPIHDFSIEKEGEDHTERILTAPKVIAIIVYNASKSETEGWAAIRQVTDEAIEKGYTVVGLSASTAEDLQQIQTKHRINFEMYTTDETALKTIIRSNPGILKLEKGTILQKLHWNDAAALDL